jgi:hypothetical protein
MPRIPTISHEICLALLSVVFNVAAICLGAWVIYLLGEMSPCIEAGSLSSSVIAAILGMTLLVLVGAARSLWQDLTFLWDHFF